MSTQGAQSIRLGFTVFGEPESSTTVEFWGHPKVFFFQAKRHHGPESKISNAVFLPSAHQCVINFSLMFDGRIQFPAKLAHKSDSKCHHRRQVHKIFCDSNITFYCASLSQHGGLGHAVSGIMCELSVDILTPLMHSTNVSS
jgi:hypothetical protein